jgi:hypothetical protein
LTSFFDFLVNFFSQRTGFKGIVTLKKVHDVALPHAPGSRQGAGF